MKMKNSSARKHTPVYALTEERWMYEPGAFRPGKNVTVLKYERGNFADNCYGTFQPHSKPRLAYGVLRVRSRRNGQLELFS